MISKEELEQKAQSGMTLKNISKIYGCSIASVHRMFKRYGIAYNDKRIKLNLKEVTEMLEQGCGNIEIAREFDCDEKTVHNFIKRNDLSELRMKRFQIQVENSKAEVICKPQVTNKRAQKCLYGGKCGNCDCCDKLLLTGERRKYDKDNPNICYDYVAATKKEKYEYRLQILGRNSDVLISGREGR